MRRSVPFINWVTRAMMPDVIVLNVLLYGQAIGTLTFNEQS
jgi:hypothetical protein